MTRGEAQDLAVRILGVFNGPNAMEWEEELALLDAGRAGTAFQRCKREHAQRWLSIAEYLTVYRSLNTDDASTKSDCPDCSGSGWVEGGWYVHKEHPYSCAIPCRCKDGKIAAASKLWAGAESRQWITEMEAEQMKPKRAMEDQ